MFSEYASRFLAQSRSQLGLAVEERQQSSRQQRHQSNWRPTHGSRLTAGRHNNPATSQTGFPFSSRLRPQEAPLFYSATDEFREENDEQEHEREIADFYALQKSRRHLGGSNLKESQNEDSASSSQASGDHREIHESYSRTGGIKSSWKGGKAGERSRITQMEDLEEAVELDESVEDAGHLSDIRLAETMRTDLEDEPPGDLVNDPPSIPRSDDDDQRRLIQAHSEIIDLPPTLEVPVRHDQFFAHVYLLALASMFTTWFVIFLHTEAPGRSRPLGDTVYTTLHGSFHLLGVYTLVSIFVSLFWLAALRAYVRQLVFGVLTAVPVVLYAFSLYPFISSFKGSWQGHSTQDSAMRWTSLVPFLMATLWIIAVIRGRLAMQKAVSIVEFSAKVLAANPALLMVGFAVLGSIIVFTWIWLSMFTRIFLGGHRVAYNTIVKFAIDASTWWLGAYFILVYLWTVSIMFALQRTITSATVSQWYFHRLAVPAPTSQIIVKAAVAHSTTILFGTVALFTALSLLVRLPLLVLPKRLTMLMGVALYSFIPSPLATLINPLTLTYAAIHSQPLAVSSRGLSQLHFLSPSDPTTSLHPRTFSRNNRDGWAADAAPLLPYRLAKLVLHATRFVMSLALGFGGWVSTARQLKLAGSEGVRGSLYAYIIGLVAGAIGWAVMGAMEGVLACIVDAVVVCWSSEVGSSGRGEVRYCREAGYLFSEDKQVGPVSLA